MTLCFRTTALPTFGTGSITFGTPATSIPNQPSFGAAIANPPSTGFQFGAPTTSASTPNLFASNFKPSGFGTPAQAVGLFNTPASTTTTSGLTFGILFLLELKIYFCPYNILKMFI